MMELHDDRAAHEHTARICLQWAHLHITTLQYRSGSQGAAFVEQHRQCVAILIATDGRVRIVMTTLSIIVSPLHEHFARE
jgi:hypothetical protein